MERLKERNGKQVLGKYGVAIFEVLERLAAYEDTGLTPAEVAELAEAKKDGRLVVLPCKVGDTIFVLTNDTYSGIEEATVNGFIVKRNRIHLNADCQHDDWGRSVWAFKPSDFGKTVFLTREEAEEALRKEQER